MKKYLSIIIVIIVLAVIGVFVYFNNSSKQGSPIEQVKTGGNNVFSSIKDAMSKSLSLKCEYQNVEGKSTTYVKGDKVRVITETTGAEAKIANLIFKDNKMWIWNNGEKEGFIFEIDEQSVDKEDELSGQTNKEELIEELEQYKDKCSTTIIQDSMFSPPSDVTFKNLNNLQEEMMEGLDDITGLPEMPVEEE